MKKSLIKHPLAWIPLVMSFSALLLVIGYVAFFGVQKSEDEGIAAHLFQLLMAGQIPIVIFFVAKFLTKMPKQTMIVLGLQIIGIILALAPVFILEM